ncbi:hypothetical protein HY413_00865 [Candidatus Kaiserbacteria bacterium]|nr:hypothetical protein [Candidatus Kaiserbacteria bacterium]
MIEGLANLDLLAVGVTGSAIGLMGFVVFLGNRHSATTKTFLLFALLTILWTFMNFVQYKLDTVTTTLMMMRFNLFVAVWHATLFLQLALIFPYEQFHVPRWYTRGVIPLSIATSLLTLTPLVFSGIGHLAPPGQVTNPSRGVGIMLFGAVTIGFLVWGVLILLRRMLVAEKDLRAPIRLMLIGMSLTALLILILSVIFPILFNDLTFLPFAALFMLPLIGLISYGIYQRRLFNIKVVAVEALVFVIGVITFVEVVFSTDPVMLLVRGIFLVLIVIAGILLTQSVTREVEQREKIQELAGDLEVANRQQESLIHFISHEVKGALGKCSGIMSLILDGDYGPAPARMAEAVANGLTHTREAADMLTTILLSASLKTGAISFNMRPFSFKKSVETVVHSLKRDAEAKQLQLNYSLPETDCTVIGDENMLATHVIRNLIDNAIRYTPAGSIEVLLQASPDSLALSVKDSGVGLTAEDKALLFTAGGRGKDSVKVNVNSTGYGLFFAKQIVEAHRGTVSADSEGRGKGSTFTVTLPRATI